jgi:hypothetical protein
MRSIATSRRALLLLSAVALFVNTAPSHAGEQYARYQGQGAHVVRIAGITVTDEGSMTCSLSTGAGTGGSCLRFDPLNPAPAVSVQDSVNGTNQAFQVCLDNNGDGFCTSPESGPCADDIVFSHADGGAFFNPLSVAKGFRPGCPGSPFFPGYVVFLCGGTHVDSTGAHQHTANGGTTSLVVGGTGTGNFCGGTQQNVSRKHYSVTP